VKNNLPETEHFLLLYDYLLRIVQMKESKEYRFVLLILKGQYHEIFDFRFFSWISFLQALEYSRAVFPKFLFFYFFGGMLPLFFFLFTLTEHTYNILYIILVERHSCGDIHSSKCTVSLTLVANGKIFTSEKFYLFCLDTYGCRVNL